MRRINSHEFGLSLPAAGSFRLLLCISLSQCSRLSVSVTFFRRRTNRAKRFQRGAPVRPLPSSFPFLFCFSFPSFFSLVNSLMSTFCKGYVVGHFPFLSEHAGLAKLVCLTTEIRVLLISHLRLVLPYCNIIANTLSSRRATTQNTKTFWTRQI